MVNIYKTLQPFTHMHLLVTLKILVTRKIITFLFFLVQDIVYIYLHFLWLRLMYFMIMEVVLVLTMTFLLYLLHQVCSSVFNSWDQFKDHLVSHTGVKPNHCTMCDMWFTNPKELKTHLKLVHSAEDNKSAEEMVISESAAAAALTITTHSIEGAETVLLDDGIQVENVTVEPVDVMEMEETATVVVEDGGVAEMCEEDVERLKQAGVQIQVVHVTATEIDGEQVLNSQVEVGMEDEMVNVEVTEQAVVV